jgi:hypothetical protein
LPIHQQTPTPAITGLKGKWPKTNEVTYTFLKLNS